MTPDLQAKVDEIRERAKSHRAMDRMDRTMYASGVIDAMLADIDTLLAALDAERAENAALLKQWNDLDKRNEQRHREWSNERAATVAWLRMKSAKQKAESEDAMTPWYAAEQDALSCENATNADAIARGEHREGKGDG